jgi:hypothetical protein
MAWFCRGLESASPISLRTVQRLGKEGAIRLLFKCQGTESFNAAVTQHVVLHGNLDPEHELSAEITHIDPWRSEVEFSTRGATFGEEWCDVAIDQTHEFAAQSKKALQSARNVHIYLGDFRRQEVDVPVIAGMIAVSRFTGGRELTSAAAIPNRGWDFRAICLNAIGGIVGGLWLLRGLMRRRQWSVWERESRREAAALTDEPPQPGSIAERGDSLSRPSTLYRSGPFAFYESFEAGDRLSEVVSTDLLLWTHTTAANRRPVVPRVARRFEEHGVTLGIAVNLGWSMRVPGDDLRFSLNHVLRFGQSVALRPGSKTPPKIAAAMRLVEILSALAWGRGAEVTVFNAAGKGNPILGPMRMAPSPDAIRVAMLSAHFDFPPQTPPGIPWQHENIQRWIYISDLLHESRRTLSRDIDRLSSEGVSLGAIALSSTNDLQLTDIGVTTPAMMCDRAESVPSDIHHAHQELIQSWDELFDRTEGGLVRIDTSYSGRDMLAAIDEGRLLELLR